MVTQYSLCQDTNKVVCVLCWNLLCTEEPSTHSCHEPNKTNPIFPSYFFQTVTFTLSSRVSKEVPPVQAIWANFVLPSFLYACYMPHEYYPPCYEDINIWWRETELKLTTETSASLYSYLPLTWNILLTTLLSQTPNLCSSLDIRHQISHPHKMTGTMSIL